MERIEAVSGRMEVSIKETSVRTVLRMMKLSIAIGIKGEIMRRVRVPIGPGFLLTRPATISTVARMEIAEVCSGIGVLSKYDFLLQIDYTKNIRKIK